MYLTIPASALWAVIVLVLCAIICVGVLIRRVKTAATAARKASDDLVSSEAKMARGVKDLAAKDRAAELQQRVITDLQERIKGLEGSIAAREAEVTRLQRLVKKAEQDADDAREERDKQTNRANDENISRSNTETQLFAARHGEDPETESFYRAHMDLLAPAPAEPAADAVAEPSAQEVAPAETETKPKAIKKRPTKG